MYASCCYPHHFMTICHMSNSRECMEVNGEALQLHAVHKKLYSLLQVTRESVSVLQVMQELIAWFQVQFGINSMSEWLLIA